MILFQFARLLLLMQPLRLFAMSKSINYLKPVGNCNGEQQVKLPDPTSPLMKEIPSVISAANNNIESSMKESSTKMDFYKHMNEDGICTHTALESGIFVKKPWDSEW